MKKFPDPPRWFPARVQLPAQAVPVVCQCFTVHPWDNRHGQTSDSGAWLSAQNAVSAVSDRLARVSGGVVILLVSGSEPETFISSLSELSQVLPLPELEKTRRLAGAQIHNSASKMQIPLPPPPQEAQPLPLRFSTLNQAAASRKTAAASAPVSASVSGLQSALAEFKTRRRQMTDRARSALAAVTAKTARCDAFVCPADMSLAREEMLKNVPHAARKLAAAVVFAGEVSAVTDWLEVADAGI